MNKAIWILEAPIGIRSGYSELSLTLGKSLLKYTQKISADLYINPTPWGHCSRKIYDNNNIDPEERELLNRIIRSPIQRQPEVFIKISIPPEFSSPAKYNIGITAGLESSAPPGIWLEKVNSVDLTLTTSQHSKDIFTHTIYTKKNPNGTEEELKVNKPIEIVPWGADLTKYYKTNIKVDTLEETMKNIPEEFAFLFVGQWTNGNINGDRKNIGNLIRTFLETFINIDNPPCLIIKTSGAQVCVMDRYECINKINDVTNMVKGAHPEAKLPNVYLLHGELSDVEMNALYNHEKVKVHLSLTRGEGFSGPALMSTLSGKPTIYPKYSGHLDFLNPQYCQFFPGKLIPLPPEALNEWFIQGAKWFEVDYDEVKRIMKNCYYNYSDKLLENAEKLRLENIEKFSTLAMDKIFHGELDKYVPVHVQESAIILPKLKRINLPKINFSTGDGKPVQMNNSSSSV